MAGLLGWPFSAVINGAIRTCEACIADPHQLAARMSPSVETMVRELMKTRAAATSIEDLGTEDPKLLSLYAQMKELFYEAEDVVDELQYQIQKSKVCNSKLNILEGIDLMISRRGIIRRLETVNSNLGTINRVVHEYLNSLEVEASRSNLLPKISSRFEQNSVVVGREKECKEIIGRLLNGRDESRSVKQPVTIISIVGLGGIGKTTLARMIYDKPRVKAHFDLQIWLSVSMIFDPVNLTREILKVSSPKMIQVDCVNLDGLQMKLRASIMSKKFLLVLDDVWYDEEKTAWENRDRWKTFLAPLRCGVIGSKILVTTRMQLVADMLDASKNTFYLDGLSDKATQFIFEKAAFQKSSSGKKLKLQQIWGPIAPKCNGLPFAALVVGSQLKKFPASKEFASTLDIDVQPEIMSPLLISYYSLPKHLQICFGFCSIFPKRWKFECKMLVNMWIAQGFIQEATSTCERLEDMGMEYFEQLLARSFFQELNSSGSGQNQYQMHDIIHDLAQFVSSGECFRVENNTPDLVPPTVRHISVLAEYRIAELKKICNLEKLRTLLVINDVMVQSLKGGAIAKLKKLRVLDFVECHMENLTKDVGKLIHLRSLRIGNITRSLPKSLSKLLNLHMLTVPGNCEFEKPEAVSKLANLRHLEVKGGHPMAIRNIGKLTHLQQLDEFTVRNQRGYHIKELKDLVMIRGKLHIRNLENVRNRDEASEARLFQKSYLNSLTLEWSSNVKEHPVVDAEVIECLQPPPDLKELHIKRYRGLTFPSWMKDVNLSNLEFLHLSSCRSQTLPTLGTLPFLRVLHFQQMLSVKNVGDEFYGNANIVFPYLEVLEFKDLPLWTEWKNKVDCHLFPRLKKLRLASCPKLLKMPQVPPSVRKLKMKHIGLVSFFELSPLRTYSYMETSSISILRNRFLHQDLLDSVKCVKIKWCKKLLFMEQLHNFWSLKKLQISQCDVTEEDLGQTLAALTFLSSLKIAECLYIKSVTMLPPELTQLEKLLIQDCQMLNSLDGLNNLVSLRSLMIKRCSKLCKLPSSMKSLPSLKTLSISSCPKLKYLPATGFPPSLGFLYINACDPTLAKSLHLKRGPEWEKLAFVPKVIIR